jgi:hypothetical protein
MFGAKEALTVQGGTPQKSGVSWVAKFRSLDSVNGLTPEFAANFVAFKAALEEADIKVQVTATYRPPERSYRK